MTFAENIYWLYYRLPDFSRAGKPGRVIDKVLAYLTKKILDRSLPSFYQKTLNGYKLNTEPREKKIICSITSFPARIDSVWIAIESLFRQSVKPDQIILWLSKDQFPNASLPQSLSALISKGLKVEFCEGDMKAHKKYLGALKKFPEDLVFTFDDDLYHERHSIENLLKLHAAFPELIVTNRAHKMTMERTGSIRPYRQWEHNTTESKPSALIVATGGCGTLYQQKSLHPDFSNIDLIKELCFNADDIWLKVMAHRAQTMVVTNNTYGKDPIVIGKTQREKLVTTNVLSGGNDEQLRKTLAFFKLDTRSFLNT